MPPTTSFLRATLTLAIAAGALCAQEPLPVAGRVVDDRGAPVAGAAVVAVPFGHAAVTDAHGAFRLPALPAHPPLLLQALRPGQGTVLLDLGAERPPAAQLSLRRPGTVRGRVVARGARALLPSPNPGPKAPVIGERGGPHGPVFDARSGQLCVDASWRVDPDGSFEAGNLGVDRVRIALAARGHLPHLTDPLPVAPGGVTDAGTVNLARAGRLRVRVVDGTGTPKDGVEVRIDTPIALRPRDRRSGPGPCPGCGPVNWPRTVGGVHERHVDVPGRHFVQAFDRKLGLASRMLAIELRPSEDAEVTLELRTSDERSRDASVAAGTVRVVAGRLDVAPDHVLVVGPAPSSRSGDRWRPLRRIAEGDVLRFVTFTTGPHLLQWRTRGQVLPHVRRIDVRAAPRGGEGRAIVLDDPCGTLRIALSRNVDAEVDLHALLPEGAMPAETFTAPCRGGAAEIRGVPAGRYRVVVRAGGHPSLAFDDVVVRPGETTPLESFLRPLASVEFRLAWTDGVPVPAGVRAELTSLASGTTWHASVVEHAARFGAAEAGAHRLTLRFPCCEPFSTIPLPDLRVTTTVVLASGAQVQRVRFRPEAVVARSN